MDISMISRSINRAWLRRSIAAASALLVASTVALSLASRPSLHATAATVPAPRVSSAPSAARLRYEDFKLRQSERLDGAGSSVMSAARLRYEDFKLRQSDLARP